MAKRGGRYYKAKSGQSVKITACIIAVILVVSAILTFLAWGSKGFTDWDVLHWFKTEPEADGGDDTSESGGLLINVGEVNGFSCNVSRISSSEYEDYGISPQTDSAYELSITVTPESMSEYARADWAVTWQDTASEWAGGKTVTDYVTITPKSDGALTATAECKQSFGACIEITATSRDDASKSVSYTCDYAKRVTGFNISGYSGLNASGVVLSSDISSYTFEDKAFCFNYTALRAVFEYSDYTIDDKLTPTYNVAINPELNELLYGMGIDLEKTETGFNGFQYLWGGSSFFYQIFSLPYPNNVEADRSFCQIGIDNANDAIDVAYTWFGVKNKPIYTWTVKCEGTYSTYEYSIPVYFSESAFQKIVVIDDFKSSDDNTNIIF